MNRIPSLSPVGGTPWQGGVNVTAALQFAPGVNVTLNPLPQAFVVAATTVKLSLLELMLIFMFTVPLLVTVTVFCGLELGGVACVTLPNKKNLGMRASKAKSVQRGSEPKVQISVAKSERKKVSCQDEESCTARSGSGNWMGTLFVSHLWKALHAACTHVAISEGLLREFREDAAGRDP